MWSLALNIQDKACWKANTLLTFAAEMSTEDEQEVLYEGYIQSFLCGVMQGEAQDTFLFTLL